MKPYRAIPTVLLVAIFAGVLALTIPVQAQGQLFFNGKIAYIGVDGNVYLLWGNGTNQQLTSDAVVTHNSGNQDSQVWYDCPYIMVENENYISFMKKDDTSGQIEHTIFDLTSNTIVAATPTGEDYCNYPGMDERGLYYIIDEFSVSDSGDEIQREYRQYLSGEIVPIYEITTKPIKSGIAFSQNLVAFQENPYEITVYDIGSQQYSRIIVPIENVMSILLLSENRLVVTSRDTDELASVDLGTGQADPWGFSINHAIVFSRADVGHYWVKGDTGEGTPTVIYKVDINGESGELLYSTSEPVPVQLSISGDGSHLVLLEGYGDTVVPGKLMLVDHSGASSLISTSADFHYGWSSDYSQLYYFELTPTSENPDLFNRELFVYDIRSGARAKMLDVIALSTDRILDSPAFWKVSEAMTLSADSESVPTADSAVPTLEGQTPVFPTPTGFSFGPALIVGGLGIIALLGVGAGAIFWLNRPKPAVKKSVSHNDAKPAPASPQVQEGIRLAREKRFKESFDLLRGLIQSEANNPEVWYYLGYDLINMGDNENAEKCLSRAKQLGHPKADRALEWIRTNRQK